MPDSHRPSRQTLRDILKMVGNAQIDVGAQLANYEMDLSENVIAALTDMIEVCMSHTCCVCFCSLRITLHPHYWLFYKYFAY